MKTPVQWMGKALTQWNGRPRMGPTLSEELISAIQRDAIAHKYRRFTEATLTTPGWYFWYPHRLFSNPACFVLVESEMIKTESSLLAGTYLGPVEPPKLEDAK